MQIFTRKRHFKTIFIATTAKEAYVTFISLSNLRLLYVEQWILYTSLIHYTYPYIILTLIPMALYYSNMTLRKWLFINGMFRLLVSYLVTQNNIIKAWWIRKTEIIFINLFSRLKMLKWRLREAVRKFFPRCLAETDLLWSHIDTMLASHHFKHNYSPIRILHGNQMRISKLGFKTLKDKFGVIKSSFTRYSKTVKQ